MKTQITVSTSDSVRTLIALKLRGELRLASREEVREYMEEVVTGKAIDLQLEVDQMAAFAQRPDHPTVTPESPEDARE